ncbi:MAG: TonB-dependent receptor [Bacteroidota bacterium]
MRNLMLLGLLAIAASLPANTHYLEFAAPNPSTLLGVCNSQSTLSGTILSVDTNEPLEYATISVYTTDDELIEGTVSDENGQFQLQLKKGNYVLKIEFIGFEAWEQTIELERNTNLETILMNPDQLTLDAVEVRAEKTQMNLLIDKKVFNVGEDALAQGGSANEVLEQLPSVNVSAEGQVSLRGNSGVRVLINGRPSALADNNGLVGIPAASIEKVEIITNPSARYEASGTAGIINIILKKEQQRGYGGTVSASTGFPANHQLNTNLNFRREKFNAFANAGLRYSNYRGAGDLSRLTIVDGIRNNLDQVFTQDRNDKAINAYVGMDYNFNPSATLTTTYSIYHMINDDFSNTNYQYQGDDGLLIQELDQDLDYLEPGTYQQLDIIYTQDLATEGEKLTLYLNNDLWEEQESENTMFTNHFAPSPPLLNYRTSTIESSRDHLLQADYEKPLGEQSKLELGLRGETRIISSDYLAEEWEDENWAVLDGFDNEVDYFERIGSAYVQYAYQGEAIGLQLGLRNEYTLVKVESVAEQIEDIKKTYNRLFPSVNLNYKLSEKTQTQLSYSRRIRRPQFWQLNPFRGISDPNVLFLGNPDLDPAYSDRVELNIVKRWEKLTLNPAIYATTTTDYFEFVIDRTDDNIFDFSTGTIVTKPVNLERENELGFELVTSYRLHENATLNGEFNYYHYQQRGDFEDRNFDFDFATWTAGMNLQLDLPADFRFQARGFYSAPYKTVQSIDRAQYNGNFSLSKKWGKRLTLSINTRSPRWFRSTTFRPDFNQDQFRAWNDVWRTGLNLQYRFEKGAESQGRRERGSIR